MNKKFLLILPFILFLIQGCGCDCPEISKPGDGYTTSTASVIVYADACAPSDGGTIMEGKSYSSSTPVPNAQCDIWSNGNPGNRGRWVMVPAPNSSTSGGNNSGMSVSTTSNITISAYGTVYYCSSGYDNYNPSPVATVYPGTAGTDFFYDSRMDSKVQMTVEKGQLVILNINDPSSSCHYTPSNSYCPTGRGVAIGVTGNNATALPVCTSSQYSNFVNGECRSTNGFGLTINIDSNQVATLDNQYYSGNAAYYTSAASRTANLYSPYIPSSLYSSSSSTFFTTIDNDYGENPSNAGPAQYVFIAPYTGILNFSIANKSGNPDGGYGTYVITVLTAPSSCAVNNSIAYSEDDRGALQVMVEESGVSPNTLDNVFTTFNSFDPYLQTYYPELMQYLANAAGLTIQSDASALNDLLVPSTGTSGYNPLVLTAQTNNGYPATSGNIWLKIKDDYYNDNVGAYKVEVTVETPDQSEVSAFLNSLITPIVSSLEQGTLIIYDNFFSQENNFTGILHMALLLYVMVFGAQYLLGLSSFSLIDTFVRILKLAAVVELLKPTSWDFYNQYFFNIYTQGQAFLITAVTGDASTNYQGVFGFVDDVFNVFFSSYTWQQLAALLPDLIGFLYAMVLIMVMFIYLTALAQVFMVYLLALIGMYVLMALAPMFMATLLFNRTKKFFLNWIKYLFSFAIQPVILFAMLFVVNEIFMILWDNAMSFNICWGGVWELYFYGVYIWTFNAIQPFELGCVQYYKIMDELPIYEMFAEIMMLYFFALNTQAIISYAPKISDSISGTSTASSLMKLSAGTISSAAKLVMGDPIAKADKMKSQENKAQKEEKTNAKIGKRIDKLKSLGTSKTQQNDKPDSGAKSSSSTPKTGGKV